MQDLLVLSVLAVLRVGIPVAAILGVSYLLLRYSKAQMLSDIQAPPEAATLAPADWARAVTVPPRVPCWEEKQCDTAKRASCAAYKRSHVPCWLAVQVSEGQLRSACVSCDMYRLEQRQAPYLRVVKGRKADRQAAAEGEARSTSGSAAGEAGSA